MEQGGRYGFDRSVALGGVLEARELQFRGEIGWGRGYVFGEGGNVSFRGPGGGHGGWCSMATSSSTTCTTPNTNCGKTAMQSEQSTMQHLPVVYIHCTQIWGAGLLFYARIGVRPLPLQLMSVSVRKFGMLKQSLQIHAPYPHISAT